MTVNNCQSKPCSKCHEVKDFALFGPDKRAKDKLASRCRACAYVATLASRAKKPEKYLSHKMNWDRKNPHMVRAAKDRYLERMNDTYLAWLLQMQGFGGGVTQDLIDLKRQQLSVFRLSRQLKEATRESSKDTDRIAREHGRSDDAG
jgi:hypothetical protein